MTYTCMIVDDEPIGREVIRQYVSKLPNWEVADISINGLEALSKLKEITVDALFLDINMPEMTGLELATILSGKEKPHIVFTTAYSEHAVDGFTLAAVDYLVKPIPFDRFCVAIDRLEDKLAAVVPTPFSKDQENVIYIRADRRDYRISHDQILYLEAYGDYVKVHCKNQMLLTKERLTNLEKVLPKTIFKRVHRSFIINLNEVAFYEGNHCDIGGVKVPISEKYR